MCNTPTIKSLEYKLKSASGICMALSNLQPSLRNSVLVYFWQQGRESQFDTN